MGKKGLRPLRKQPAISSSCAQGLVSGLQIQSLEDYHLIYQRSLQAPEVFWDDVGRQIEWYSPWRKVLDASNRPFFKWYVGGKTNIVLNSIDRHLQSGRQDHTAIYWEGEAGEKRALTYGELDREVSKFANVLKSLGVGKSNTVAIYMPRVLEQAVAMLACAKIGAVHTVVYAGLSVEALRSRITDCGTRLLITADGGRLGNKIIELKNIADAAARDPSRSSTLSWCAEPLRKLPGTRKGTCGGTS